MTRSEGRKTQMWREQVIHIEDPHITSQANLALLIKQYFVADKSIYTSFRMSRVRRKWMKQQLKTPDALGGLTCAICGKQGLQVHSEDRDMLATLDHIVPISRNGKWNDFSNFQVACDKCNNKKDNNKLKKGLTQVLTYQ